MINFSFFVQTVSSVGLELDLEHYVVPAPSNSANSARVYAANLTENPRSRNSSSGSDSYSAGDDSFSFDLPETVNI
jgi:6-phosphofructo-2-kinase/fructose-2,6-biphosphatase